MPLEVLAPAEALAALDAAVGLLSGVDPFVLLQVSRLAEAAAAHQAAVRLLAGVTPLVDPEVPDAAEYLPANLTHVVLLVSRAVMLPVESERGRCRAPAAPYTPPERAQVRLEVHTRADVVLPGCQVPRILTHGHHNLRELLLLLGTFRSNGFGFHVHARRGVRNTSVELRSFKGAVRAGGAGLLGSLSRRACVRKRERNL